MATPFDRGAVVSVRRLTKEYGDVVALQDIALDVTRGRLLGLVGPNGAGKSTLVGCLTGLIEPDAGEINLFGRRFSVDSAEAKRRIGVMTADLALFDELTADEFLRFIAGMYAVEPAVARTRTAELLDALDLADAAFRRIAGYSSGMRQKLAFAAAVLPCPELLVLDEPFANVDPETAAMLRAWLKQFVERHGTVIVTSHGLSNIEALCSEVVILHHGRIAWQGTPRAAGGAWETVHDRRTFGSLEELYLHLVGSPDRRLAWL